MIKERIQQDLKKALLEKRELELSVLRMLSAAILTKEKEKRYNISRKNPKLNSLELEKESQLTDEEAISVLSLEIKKRKESRDIFKRAGRNDLVEKEEKELKILQKYLS